MGYQVIELETFPSQTSTPEERGREKENSEEIVIELFFVFVFLQLLLLILKLFKRRGEKRRKTVQELYLQVQTIRARDNTVHTLSMRRFVVWLVLK